MEPSSRTRRPPLAPHVTLPHRSSAVRGPARLVTLLLFTTLAIAGLGGCANTHAVQTLPDGITVHTFRRDHANAFVVSRGDQYFMVDAGYEAQAPALADDLRREGFEPSRLRAIVLTHGHPDHAGGAGYFRRTFGTPVVAGAADVRLLARGAADPLCPTSDRARDRVADDEAARFTPLNADRVIDAEAGLEDLVGLPGRILPLPGHTEGSLVVSLPGAVFVGDLFRGAIVGRSAEVHFYMCDLDDNRRDVGQLLDVIAPNADTFFTGHFGPVKRDAVLERFGKP